VFRLGAQPDGAPAALFSARLTTTQTQQLWSPDPPAYLPYLLVVATAAFLAVNVLPPARLLTARGD
jgi:hypothetical protein